MKKIFVSHIFLLLSLIIFTTCTETTLKNPVLPSQKNSNASNVNDCVCVDLWLPVCGDNGKTYSNACFAQCAHVNFKQGSCSQDIAD